MDTFTLGGWPVGIASVPAERTAGPRHADLPIGDHGQPALSGRQGGQAVGRLARRPIQALLLAARAGERPGIRRRFPRFPDRRVENFLGPRRQRGRTPARAGPGPPLHPAGLIHGSGAGAVRRRQHLRNSQRRAGRVHRQARSDGGCQARRRGADDYPIRTLEVGRPDRGVSPRHARSPDRGPRTRPSLCAWIRSCFETGVGSGTGCILGRSGSGWVACRCIDPFRRHDEHSSWHQPSKRRTFRPHHTKRQNC